MKNTHSLVFLACLMFALTGCETTNVAETAETSPPESLEIKRGTSVTELLHHIGEPSKKYAMGDPELQAEVWVYEREIVLDTEEIIVDTRTEMYWDHDQEEIVEYEQPVYEMQVTKAKVVTEFLIVAGEVYSWKQKQDAESLVSGKKR
jgi:hypothetical protein